MTETEKKEAAQSSIRAAEVCFVIKEKLSQEMLGIDLNDGLLNILSSLRFKKTFRELQQSERQGNRKASRQVVEVMNLNNRWLHGQLPSGGIPFKTNPRHILLMLYGLSAGLDTLTSSELVQFFDDNCPCRKIHNQQSCRGSALKCRSARPRFRRSIAQTGQPQRKATNQPEVLLLTICS
jgi:hypothetical protein